MQKPNDTRFKKYAKISILERIKSLQSRSLLFLGQFTFFKPRLLLVLDSLQTSLPYINSHDYKVPSEYYKEQHQKESQLRKSHSENLKDRSIPKFTRSFFASLSQSSHTSFFQPPPVVVLLPLRLLTHTSKSIEVYPQIPSGPIPATQATVVHNIIYSSGHNSNDTFSYPSYIYEALMLDNGKDLIS